MHATLITIRNGHTKGLQAIQQCSGRRRSYTLLGAVSQKVFPPAQQSKCLTSSLLPSSVSNVQRTGETGCGRGRGGDVRGCGGREGRCDQVVGRDRVLRLQMPRGSWQSQRQTRRRRPADVPGVSSSRSLLLVVPDIGQSPLLAVWPGSQLHLIAKLHMRMFTYSLMASWRAAQSLWGIFTTQYVKLRLIEAGNQVPR